MKEHGVNPYRSAESRNHDLRRRIRRAQTADELSGDAGIPRFVGMEFISYVSVDSEPYAWSIYISHDPCHDSVTAGYTRKADRNTVVAIHRKGSIVVIGRELPRLMALDLANGVLENGSIDAVREPKREPTTKNNRRAPRSDTKNTARSKTVVLRK